MMANGTTSFNSYNKEVRKTYLIVDKPLNFKCTAFQHLYCHFLRDCY